jgi:Virulence-associated protein E-like domain/Bifunctional DNA primase/polymerase, N-terminal
MLDSTQPKATPLDIALDLIARGIAPVPVPIGAKGPTIPKWQHLVITAENASHYFNSATLNVGAIMGPRSGGLTDIDLDCREAVALAIAPYFLPRTGSIYGRPSKRQSHWLYTTADPYPKGSIKLADENNKVIVELRMGGGGKGAQSVMPGSVHKSGERYEWDVDGERAHSQCTVLKLAATKIAVATILVRLWPERNRHDAALCVGGFLARAGWGIDDIGHFIVAVQEVAGVDDPSHVEGGRKAAVDAAEHHAEGGHVYGLPTLIEFFGEPAAKKIAKLIGYRGSTGATYTNTDGFVVGDRGRPIAKSQQNIRRAMELLEVEVRYDTFNDRMTITGLDGCNVVDDAAMLKLWLLVDDQYHFLPEKTFFFAVIEEAARCNSFHPVIDYLDSLVWDGVERLDKWLITYGGAEDTSYTRAIGSITLIAAVRRVRQPGCKFDEMLILESPQGFDKSKMLATIAYRQEWFSDDLPLGVDGKRVIEQTRGKWIIEAAELSGMRRADIEHLKALLSRQFDSGRMVWDKLTANRPRQFIIFGTTNKTVYLKDDTGNRRHWPTKVGRFDTDAIARDRDQLWAEAAAREKAGESIRLDPSLWDAAAEQQSERTVTDPWHELLEDIFGDVNGKIPTADVWNALGVDPKQRSQDQNERLGSAMKDLGFERKKLRVDGKPRCCYARGTAEERETKIFFSYEDGALVAKRVVDEPTNQQADNRPGSSWA